MVRTATLKGRLPLVAGSVAVAAVGAVALGSDLMVGYGFGKALGTQKPALPFELADPRRPVGEVGDEVYWLSRSEFHSQAASDRPLAVGDRLRVPGPAGRARVVEVVEIQAVDTPLLRASMGAVAVLYVTCRPVGPEGLGRLEHYLVTAEEPKPGQARADRLGRT